MCPASVDLTERLWSLAVKFEVLALLPAKGILLLLGVLSGGSAMPDDTSLDTAEMVLTLI